MFQILSGLEVLREVSKIWSDTRGGSDSLVEYTNVARVEPICLIDADVMFSDMLPDTMQSLQSIFSGYYLQAFAISMSIGSINVVKHLEKLNPNRSAGSAIGSVITNQIGAESYATPREAFGLESYYDFTHRLPMPGDPRNMVIPSVALEADEDVAVANVRDAAKEVRELTNLSVGKLFNVEVTDGEKKAMIPISIRLLANSITTDGLVHILSAGSKEVSVKERWYQWRSGQIEFFRDLVLCQDLIDEHKKNLMKDKEGYYDAILRRRANNAASSILSQNASVATASNIVVVSADTITKLELSINGSIKNFKVRQKIFETTYLMLMAVVDKQWERVTFYHRGIPDATTVRLADMKIANKNTGPNVLDILNAFKAGSAPAF